MTAAPIEKTNLPPSIQSASSKSIGEGQTLLFTVSGDDPDNDPSGDAAILQISELQIDAGDISANEPSATYDPESDLGLQPGDPACFRVSAFDETNE